MLPKIVNQVKSEREREREREHMRGHTYKQLRNHFAPLSNHLLVWPKPKPLQGAKVETGRIDFSQLPGVWISVATTTSSRASLSLVCLLETAHLLQYSVAPSSEWGGRRVERLKKRDGYTAESEQTQGIIETAGPLSPSLPVMPEGIDHIYK